jgi:hypothetical protein
MMMKWDILFFLFRYFLLKLQNETSCDKLRENLKISAVALPVVFGGVKDIMKQHMENISFSLSLCRAL